MTLRGIRYAQLYRYLSPHGYLLVGEHGYDPDGVPNVGHTTVIHEASGAFVPGGALLIERFVARGQKHFTSDDGKHVGLAAFLIECNRLIEGS